MEIVSYDTQSRNAGQGDKPTSEYSRLQAAYDYFNLILFGGILPDCLITLQRKRGARGYFWSAIFASRSGHGSTDELAMNPETFDGRTDLEILSTLAHEMCHVWQAHHGTPSRAAYHNKEWADKMIAIGLMPSHTGQPGGKMTGQRVMHYVMPDGPFDRAAMDLLANGAYVRWQTKGPGTSGAERERQRAAARSKESKTKYTCSGCGQNAWAKPGARLMCGDCEEEMSA